MVIVAACVNASHVCMQDIPWECLISCCRKSQSQGGWVRQTKKEKPRIDYGTKGQPSWAFLMGKPGSQVGHRSRVSAEESRSSTTTTTQIERNSFPIPKNAAPT
ncbi:hypothetical protein CDAR_40681 [Caerostris darwini]|uniref:Secreted protein n=1 Tax=Caerostris darwini TaxID=1538125 RepID=A0AAV4T7F8_9ARAC|nr:hypothetical protein CDAR_40681 [Caerostris darwini]